MGYYRSATICENGHVLNATRAVSDKYCTECNAKVITKCPYCGNPIRGMYESDSIVIFPGSYKLPKYCYNCGEAYPWTEKSIKNTQALICEDDSLSNVDKERLSRSLPDIMSETPGTQLAISHVKKALSAAGRFTSDGLRQFVIDFGCELAIKLLDS